jgi:predicted nucleic acid-binding protein
MKLSEVDEVLAELIKVGVRVRSSFRWRLDLPDVDDNMVLETAINGGADALITFNVRHFVRASRNFGIRIISPGQALAETRGRHQ